ncbi:MAG: MopE-related protein [bacterium]
MRRLVLLCLLVCLGCEDAPNAPPGGMGGAAGDGPIDMPDVGCDMMMAEACNGLDDDCDSKIDEDAAGEGAACMSACGQGSMLCEGGQFVCRGAGTDRAETCDGTDEDCDGTVDEDAMGVDEPCATCPGVYRCAAGDLVCTGGVAELCNGMDDDCDGSVDESLARECGEGRGACEPGRETCAAGQWGACVGAMGPADEVCNGQDDDCDGMSDEGIADCRGIGGPCQRDGDCPSGLCLDDDGSFYCSRRCDLVANDCGPGNLCVEVDGRPVCLPMFSPCTSDCDCAGGLACMPSRNLPGVELACRPERRGGLPVGAECDPDRAGECATGHCIARFRRCGRLCCDQASCAEGERCVTLPGLGETTVCVTACSDDDDCPLRTPPPPGEEGFSQELCRYRPDAEMTRNVGVCDWPNVGGAAVGAACERGNECAHGICLTFPDRDNYCTKGCEAPEDCPDGWECRDSMLNSLPVKICRQ